MTTSTQQESSEQEDDGSFGLSRDILDPNEFPHASNNKTYEIPLSPPAPTVPVSSRDMNHSPRKKLSIITTHDDDNDNDNDKDNDGKEGYYPHRSEQKEMEKRSALAVPTIRHHHHHHHHHHREW